MSDKVIDYEIDLSKLGQIISKRFKVFLAIIIAMSTVAFCGSKFLMKKKYTATTTVIIVSNEETSSQGITYNDVQLSQKLVSTYSRILTSETVGDQVLQDLRLAAQGFTSQDYKRFISVKSASNNEVLDVSVTTEDPYMSASIANQAVKVFSDEVYQIMNIRNVTVLDTAKVPSHPSGPNVKRNTMIGGLLGFLICFVWTLIEQIMDKKVKTEEEVKSILNYPILAVIPEFTDKTERKFAYGINRKS